MTQPGPSSGSRLAHPGERCRESVTLPRAEDAAGPPSCQPASHPAQSMPPPVPPLPQRSTTGQPRAAHHSSHRPTGANPVSGVGENRPLSALEIRPHLDLYFRYPPNRAQPGPTRMQRQFTSHLVDLYLIPITTPPTPSLCQRDLCQFTFSPHDIPPVPLSTPQIRQATGPYLFYARTGRNQAQTLAPRQLPYFTHQIPPVARLPSLATAPPTSATPDVCRIIERPLHGHTTIS